LRRAVAAIRRAGVVPAPAPGLPGASGQEPLVGKQSPVRLPLAQRLLSWLCRPLPRRNSLRRGPGQAPAAY